MPRLRRRDATRRGWDRALLTVLDEANAEDALALLVHDAGARSTTAGRPSRVHAEPSGGAGKTEDAEACAVARRRTCTCSARSSARRPGRSRRAARGSRACSEDVARRGARRRPRRRSRSRACASGCTARSTTRWRPRRSSCCRSARSAARPTSTRRSRPAPRRASAGRAACSAGRPADQRRGRRVPRRRPPAARPALPGHRRRPPAARRDPGRRRAVRRPRRRARGRRRVVARARRQRRRRRPGFRGLDTRGGDRFDAVVGDLDAANKSATVLEDHPEGGSAAVRARRASRSRDGGRRRR